MYNNVVGPPPPINVLYCQVEYMLSQVIEKLDMVYEVSPFTPTCLLVHPSPLASPRPPLNYDLGSANCSLSNVEYISPSEPQSLSIGRDPCFQPAP